jgi:hypothetical protein
MALCCSTFPPFTPYRHKYIRTYIHTHTHTHTHTCMQINAVRMAEWHAKLGLQQHAPPAYAISSIAAGGGIVPCVRVVVQRVYPVVYMESLEGGGKIWRSGKAEERARAKFDQERILALEKFYEAQNAAKKDDDDDDDDDDEGARLFKAVEVSAYVSACMCIRVCVCVC